MLPTLVILAAGMGSRFGGNKQIERLGPSGETIMDYSVFDAIRAGFTKVVFVIKESFKEDFIVTFNTKRYNHNIQVEYAFQEIDNIPAGYSVPLNRTKPWGTNHALMMADSLVKAPFAVINADDFYGRTSFETVADFLKSNQYKSYEYCVIGFDILNTLVESGGTSRAECITDHDNNLVFIEERTEVQSINGIIKGLDMNKNAVEMNENTIVSMNFWGFTPDYFQYSKQHFNTFLDNNIDNPVAEFMIPSVVNELIKKMTVNVKVLNSHAEWFGVTYQNDKAFVQEKLMHLIKKGEYPIDLWSK
ncbi:MAG: nucleotidyltransferase [Bacteroidetes bacterium]|nr:nucleotidyltransferase [Bacteroidota bacterium]